jgi:hypothetical protein
VAFRFTLVVRGDPRSVLARVSKQVKTEGGTFSGDEKQGNFVSATTPVGGRVHGHFWVHGKEVAVEITRKPLLAPAKAIQREIEQWFAACDGG